MGDRHRRNRVEGTGYRSRAASLDVRYSTPDSNRTYAFSVSGASDDIDSINRRDGRASAVVRVHGRHYPVLNADAIVSRTSRTYGPRLPARFSDTRPDHRRSWRGSRATTSPSRRERRG
jgi:hypothetical protein